MYLDHFLDNHEMQFFSSMSATYKNNIGIIIYTQAVSLNFCYLLCILLSIL